ncbi:MAG: 50S ribosomal protein L18 [Nanoarchaeota archaeon]|nr:50S ribosomal protein L18 [Nanoarchaeota archaeon]MBU1028295.1 50S ribosomal protein L18 [Nanoarchaeota archaeon]
MKTQKRRRKESKTNYSKRIKLLKSMSPRIVFRKTNKYLIAQYILSKEAQDKVEIGVNSKDLIKYGWPKEFIGSLKSIPAAYFTGFLIGEEIKTKKETPIIDFGMIRNLHKTKIYAFLKGLVDAGVKIKTKEKVFPSEDIIKGSNLKNKIPFEEIKSKIEK